jgi:hypothetical protein
VSKTSRSNVGDNQGVDSPPVAGPRVCDPQQPPPARSAAVSKTSRSNVGDNQGVGSPPARSNRKLLRLVPKAEHSRAPIPPLPQIENRLAAVLSLQPPLPHS